MICRHCHKELTHKFVDLGVQPASNHYLSEEEIKSDFEAPKYPLVTHVCQHCWLVQTEDFASADTFFSNDYAYFSSTSKGWLNHAKEYSDDVIKQLALNSESFVVEVASNDGYLLRNFLQQGIPCLGIEPTLSTATAAREIGIPVVTEFFDSVLSEEIVKDYGCADLVVCNNVLAHVPDINDFVKGLVTLLSENGTITIEFPHLLNLIKFNQFDTIYHEHFSYLSLTTVITILNAQKLEVYAAENLNTHGGSLRVWCRHKNNNHSDSYSDKYELTRILQEEVNLGLLKLDPYIDFQDSVNNVVSEFRKFLFEQNTRMKKVVGYGAAAKANTLINSANVGVNEISYIVDAATSKQGKYMPGSIIPIYPVEELINNPPDVIIIFPWNIKDEILKVINYYELDVVVYIVQPKIKRLL